MTRHFAIQFGSATEGWSQSKEFSIAYDTVDTAIDALTAAEDWPDPPRGVPPCYRIVRVTGGANGFRDTVEPVMVYDLRVVFLAPADGDHTAINDALDKVRGQGVPPVLAGSARLVI